MMPGGAARRIFFDRRASTRCFSWACEAFCRGLAPREWVVRFPRRTLRGNRVDKREGPRLLRSGPHAAAWGARALDGGDVLRLHAPPALGRLVGDFGALFEGLEPLT